MSLGSRLEQIAEQLGPVNSGIATVTGGFFLCMISHWINLDDIERFLPNGSRKQVGFLSSLNWSIVYLILFPLYMVLFARLLRQGKATLDLFCELGIITGKDGVKVSFEEVRTTWSNELRSISTILWVLLVSIVFQTTSEWYFSCATPWWRRLVVTEPIDWSTIGILRPELVQPWHAVTFSVIAYIYMGCALFVYLTVLVYGAAYANFLSKLSDRTGELRLVFSHTHVGEAFGELFRIMYWSVFLGLCAAFFMRLQAEYIASPFLSVDQLLFRDWNDVRNLISKVKDGSDVWGAIFMESSILTTALIDSSSIDRNPTKFTGIAVAAFSMTTFLVVSYFLYSAFNNSKLYYLEKVTDPVWRSRVSLKIDENSIETHRKIIQSQRFQEFLGFDYLNLGLVIIGMLLSIVFVHVGTLFVALMLYVLISLIVKRISKMRNS